MKVVDKSGWPKVNSSWDTQEDLLLVCELAAARAGFSGLTITATPRAGNVRCSVTSPVDRDGKKKSKCNTILCSFESQQGKLIVKNLAKDKLKAEAHGEAHKDRSVPLDIDSPPFSIKQNMRVEDWMSMHLVEGALHAHARLDGRLLKRSFQNAKGTGVITISFLCAEGGTQCKFVVRLVSEEDDDGEEVPVFNVVKVVGGHSCDKDVGEPSDDLREVLEAWPAVTLGTPFKNSAKKKEEETEPQEISDEDNEIKPEPGPSPKKRAGSPSIKKAQSDDKKAKVKNEM